MQGLASFQDIGELQFGNSNLYGIVLPRAIRGVQLRDSCLTASYWRITICRVLLPFKILGYCFDPNYWGECISRLLPFVKLLRNYHLQGFASRQAIGKYNVQGLALRQANGELPFACFCVVSNYCKFQLAGYCFAPSYWGIISHSVS